MAADHRIQHGSSPLTRGKPQPCGRVRFAAGLIPAHAGKTRNRRQLAESGWAHPRSRGENHARKVAKPGDKGSSPLTRGKLVVGCHAMLLCGLIPAHAGKTKGEVPTVDGWRAHPRSRGENGALFPTARAGLGSSPLTRGKHDEVAVRCACGGLIPAHAGKTKPVAEKALSLGAHPRSRGENGLVLRSRVSRRGSSPLTRGKPPSCRCRGGMGGLIPAHAGKTF